MVTVFLLSGSTLRKGRGNNCDIRINDISVSRNHGEIRFSEGSFYLQDLNSKFGTLLCLGDGADRLQYNKGFAMQIGRSLLEIQTKTVTKKVKPSKYN